MSSGPNHEDIVIVSTTNFKGVQAYFLVADDIMDNSITRRGKPCWYREEGVGMVAINDGILLEQLAYLVIRKHLKSHAAYGDLLDLFLQTTHQTAHGQLLDLITAPIGKVDLTKYTLERCVNPLPVSRTLLFLAGYTAQSFGGLQLSVKHVKVC